MDSTLFNATDCTLKGTAKEYLTLFQFNLDAPCSGHGVCQSGVCICESGWHGESDMVNLSGYACHVQDITRQIFWGIVLAVWTITWFAAIYGLIHKYGEWKKINGMGAHGGKSSGKQPALTYFPFQFLVPNVFVTIPLTMVLALLKMFTTQAIGVDVPVTICFCLTSLGSFFLSAYNLSHQFKMLSGGRMLNSERFAKIVTRFSKGAHVSQIVFVAAKCFQVGALGAQESGPLSAPVLIATIVNNVLTLTYFIMYGVMSHSVMQSVSALLSSQSITGASVSRSQLAKVLSFMELTVNQSRKAIAFAVLVYVTISMPWFFGYQTFAYALAFIMSAPTVSKQIRMFFGSGKGNNSQGATTMGSTFNTAGSTKQRALGLVSSNPTIVMSGRDDGEEGSAFEIHSDGRVLSAQGSFSDMDSMSMDENTKMKSKNPSFTCDENDDAKKSPAQIAAREYNAGW